jgi:hypothetical protein
MCGMLACLVGTGVVSATALVSDRRGRHVWSRGLVVKVRRHQSSLVAFGLASLAFGTLLQLLVALLVIEE